VYLVLDDFGRFGRAWRPGAIEIGAELHQPLLLLLAQRRRPPRDDGSDLAFNCVYGLQRLVPAALQLAGHEAIGVRPKSHRCRRGGCDIVALKVEDVAPHGYAVERATVRQKKTGLPVRFEVTEQTQAVDDYIRAADKKPGEFLFAAPRRPGHGLSTRQYARLVAEWIRGIGLDPCMFGTHSLRRTKATLIYRRTGNLRAVQLLLGHHKIESTVRYLGIEVDDALAIAEPIDV